MKVFEKRYILGPKILENLVGFKGFEIESTEAKNTVNDLIKDLSEEEWDWIEMDLEEVEALTFMKPLEWSPKIDPRPDWRIEEIQNQTQKEGTPTKVHQANLGRDREIGWPRRNQTTQRPGNHYTKVKDDRQ